MEHPYAKIRKAERKEHLLRALHARQKRLSDGLPGRNAGSQTCVGGFIPCKKTCLAGELADLRLAEAAQAKRGEHRHFRQRFHARAVARVVGSVCAVEQNCVPVGLCPLLQCAE